MLVFSIMVFQTKQITLMVLKHNVLSAWISSDLLLFKNLMFEL